MLQGTLVSDRELVEGVRQGDDASFEELYRRYGPRIRSFVNGYVRDDGRSEDVTQEAFLSALRRLRATEGEIAFRPWIYEIARNAAIDLHRRTSRAEEVSIDAGSALRPADMGRLVGSEAPESVLADKERLEHLSGAFAELSENHHRILVLRELEGLSYREIGERMELTAPAVESTLFRARRRLEHEYSEIDTGRRCESIQSVIAKLAEGIGSPRDRQRLSRHARRCNHCRRRARELGLEPIERRSLAAKAAALIPFPAFLQRRLPGAMESAGLTHVAAGGEAGAALLAQAGALLAAVTLVGGGGGPAADRGVPGAGYGSERPAALEGSRSQPREARDAAAHGETRLAHEAQAGTAVGPEARRDALGQPADRPAAPGALGAPDGPATPGAEGAPGGGQLPEVDPAHPPVETGPNPDLPARQLPSAPEVPETGRAGTAGDPVGSALGSSTAAVPHTGG